MARSRRYDPADLHAAQEKVADTRTYLTEIERAVHNCAWLQPEAARLELVRAREMLAEAQRELRTIERAVQRSWGHGSWTDARGTHGTFLYPI